MTKEYICIVCPSSCRLTVCEENGEVVVRGHGCKRGQQHGVNEYQNPVRMLTSTVAIAGGALPRLPVIGTGELPREKLRECLARVYAAQVEAPVACGQVIIPNICDTGVDIVASRAMKQKEAD